MFHCFNDLNGLIQQKKIKSLWNSDDIADQIKEQKDKTLGIPRANLELMSYVHNLFQFGAMIDRPCNFYYNTDISLYVFSEIITCFSYHADK